jgi:hypothetical protein
MITLRKSLLLLPLLALLASPAAAQTPTVVSGTIADANGIPYSFAKVSAQLIPTTATPTVIANGIPTQIGGQSNATADANGSFSMNLFCNTAGGGCSVISPSGTQWQFTVQANGVPLPQGTGPQSCVALITVTGASQTVTSNFSCPALTRGATSSPSAVIASPLCPQSPVDPKCSYVIGDGHFVTDATVVNGSTTYTCPNSDCNFTGTDIYGRPIMKVGEATFATGDPLSGPLICSEGTVVSFTAQSVTVTPAGQCTVSNTGAAVLLWGEYDTANLQAFSAAVGCGHGVLPSAVMFTKAGQFTSVPAANCSNSFIKIYTSASYTGQNFASTWIVPTPTFDATTCTANPSNTCFFNNYVNEIDELSIWGGGNPRTNSGTTHQILALGLGTRGYNINVTGWADNELLWNGITLVGGQDILQLGGAEHAGGNCNIDVATGVIPPVTLYGNFQIGGTNAICVEGGSSAIEIDNVVSSGRSGNAGLWVKPGGTMSSFGDIIQSGTGSSAVRVDGTAQFHDSILGSNVAGTFALFTNNAGAKVTAENTIFNGSSGGGSLLLIANTSFVDECGNTFTQNGGANNIAAGATVVGSCSSGGTSLVAGNVVLSANWGTGAAVSAPLGDAHAFSFTVTNGSAAVGANPTITITYPVGSSVPFIKTPICNLWQVGGTQAVTATTAILPPSSGTTTSVVFTYPATPTVNLTEFYQGSCGP